MADHNDPNAVNSIFSDIDVSAADLYDIFGFPSDDTDGGEKVVIALTFASVPEAGVLDSDMLYRDPDRAGAPRDAGRRGGPEPGSVAEIFRGPQGNLPQDLETVRSARDRRRAESRPYPVHQFPGRQLFASDRDQQKPDAAIARRPSDQGLYRRARRCVLQRSSGLLPIDQLRAAVLSRPAHHDGSARARDPEDVPRIGGQRSVQFRSRQPGLGTRREEGSCRPGR